MSRQTYKKAGVDIEKAERFLKRISSTVKKTQGREVITKISGFGNLFEFITKYRRPVLVSSADGVGTKLKLACLVNKHDTVGIDLVAMNVNDLLCCGAEPLFFLDYISTSKLSLSVLSEVIKGIARGCLEAGCSLIGGETAEMPGMYKKGDYDLAGFCVGVVEKNRIVDGSKIKVGDKLVGLASSGLHSNGFSLVRKIFSQNELKRYASELLKPTRIYVKPLLSLLSTRYSLPPSIKAIVHITGGSFYGKIPKVLAEDKSIVINRGSWPIPKIFGLIQKKGNISLKEMFKTFNVGIGMVLVVNKVDAKRIIRKLATFRVKSWVIGEVIKGNRKVEIV